MLGHIKILMLIIRKNTVGLAPTAPDSW